MLSLAERHTDRVKRKAENMLDSLASSGGGVGAALAHAVNFTDALAGLTEDERNEVMRTSEDGFRNAMSGDVVADMTKYAGIGIPNPLIVPPGDMPPLVDLGAVEKVQAGDKSGWGDTSGNANGRAIAAQDTGASSNNGAASETPEEIAKREAKAQATRDAKGDGTTTIIPAKK
jgi:hypothetical protein